MSKPCGGTLFFLLYLPRCTKKKNNNKETALCSLCRLIFVSFVTWLLCPYFVLLEWTVYSFWRVNHRFLRVCHHFISKQIYLPRKEKNIQRRVLLHSFIQWQYTFLISPLLPTLIDYAVARWKDKVRTMKKKRKKTFLQGTSLPSYFFVLFSFWRWMKVRRQKKSNRQHLKKNQR